MEDNYKEIEYDIWASRVLGIGNSLVTPLFKIYESSKEIYENRADLDEKLPLSKAERESFKRSSIEEAYEICEKAERLGHVIIGHQNKRNYPKRLKEISDYPLVLYAAGKFVDIDDMLTISVVGARKASDYALKACEFIVADLAKAGVCIISGMAVGIDGKAHQTALDNGGKTIAVLGAGLDVDYPRENRALREEIEQSGMVISEFLPGEKPEGWHFPVRNRLLSGLSHGVFVVEGGRRSGSMLTAGHAAEQGRDVFTLPGDIFSPKSDGAFMLLKQGAAPVKSALDIIENYLYVYPELIGSENKEVADFKKAKTSPVKRVKSKAKELDLEAFSDLEREVFIKLKEGIIHLDDLILALGAPASEVLSALTMLEMDEIVSSAAGKMYELAFEYKE